VIADNPTQFAAEVVRLLRDMEARNRLENSAKSFVQKHFSWDSAAAAFADICRQVVQPDTGEQCRI
jgi:glycosyltransferase involved in cell wall biosynthesis